jgi:hypothetical protein
MKSLLDVIIAEKAGQSVRGDEAMGESGTANYLFVP